MGKETSNRRKNFNFEDSSGKSFALPSSWVQLKASRQTRSIQCQTTSELYNLQEMEVQSGRYTRITQDQITEKEGSSTLSDFLIRKYPRIPPETWVNKIIDGHVTVDCEIETDPEAKVDTDYFIEYVDSKSHGSCQTEPIAEIVVDSNMDLVLRNFLNKVVPFVFEAIEENEQMDFVNFGIGNKQLDLDEGKGKLWKLLQVDFEKKRLTFPDWTNAKHYPAVILRCSQTRNKERVYDLEYEDGSKSLCVREEHIRVINVSSDSQNNKNRKQINDRRPLLQEGMRVHAKVASRNGIVKFLPGRILKISRSLFDVECEGTRIETGLTMDDLFVGLQEGQQVEARRPSVVHLQCTSLDWNCTGSIIVASFGKNDLSGWCDIAGAICCWNVFSKTLNPTDPEFTLDHSSSLMKVCCHPIFPSLIAAGSFNGEVLVWDTTNGEQPIAVSPITEYSHKEPVVDLKWVYNSSNAVDGWLLISIGADGKVLFWSVANKLQHPIKGFLMKKKKATLKKSFLQCYGATSLAVSSAKNLRFAKPKWLVIGQEGGSFIRCQAGRLLSQQISNDSFGVASVEEIYPPLNNKEETPFTYNPHVGAVTSMDWSPFNRNIFLSGGSDGEIKLFHILEQQPIMRFRPNFQNESIGFITSVKFSPWRPMVFAAATTEGVLYIYDLRRNLLQISLKIDLRVDLTDPNDFADKKFMNAKQRVSSNTVPIADIVFNHSRKDIIAAADWKGRISMWKLPGSYAIYNNDELTGFENLCKIDRMDS